MLADKKARKGKSARNEVKRFDENRDINIAVLRDSLLDKTYKTSDYKVFKIFDAKERDVYQLPYYPDRITHHAIMNIIEPVMVSMFTADTYSCIKGRGIHSASEAVRKALRDQDNTQFCLKLDIKKFYPSVDHAVLKSLLRRKIKDQDLLWLLDEIIDSAKGLPIGNYLSQYLANYYLTGFDHWIKETKRVKYYYRYADDIVILAADKKYLHQLLAEIRSYLNDRLKLTVKGNYQVFPVQARGIDFLGYCFFHSHSRLRKTIKQRFARMLSNRRNPESMAAYKGWTMHCDSKHLVKKLLNQ